MKMLSSWMIYQFVRELTKDWKETQAFKLGIVDDKGVLLKKASDLTTKDEREAYTLFHRLIWNIKRLLEKMPGGSSKIASYTAAAWLLKENQEAISRELLYLMDHNEVSEARLMLEEVTGIANTTSGIALKHQPLFKKKEDKMSQTGKESDTKSSVLALRRKIEEGNLIAEEGKRIKKVIRQGIMKRKLTCPEGQIVKDGRCVPITSVDKQRFVRAGKKRRRSLAGKSLAGALRKRTRSLRRRSSTGLK
jgi:hypothetical protein